VSLPTWSPIAKHGAITFAVVVGALSLALPATASARKDYTWSGATPVNGGTGTDYSDWSNGTNWVGGIAPSGSVGTLTFPTLTNSACTNPAQSEACWRTIDDISGLTANRISIGPDGDFGWELFGNSNFSNPPPPIGLGSGGLTVNSASVDWEIPITLGASQTWSLRGSNPDFGAGLVDITGRSDALTLDLSSQAHVSLDGDDEVGHFTASGGGSVSLVGGALNGSDHKPVRFSGGTSLAVIFDGDVWEAIGPLTMRGGEVSVGSDATVNGRPMAPGGLTVNGKVSLDASSTLAMYIDSPGTTAGVDYSQLNATGAAHLRRARLSLGGCSALNPGDADTIVHTTRKITGTFANAPDGTIVPITCSGAPEATARITYTANSVIATVVSSNAS
jgi:hypothetical protein